MQEQKPEARPSQQRHTIADHLAVMSSELYEWTVDARRNLVLDSKSGAVDAYLLTAYDCLSAAKNLLVEECMCKAEADAVMEGKS